ncbi:MAG TPA: glycoside hydrolase family 2 protein [Micromonosporaceae bacterium]|nr:glycoside hydrolase family 2 protein [Micromonosporaceae bacterium]
MSALRLLRDGWVLRPVGADTGPAAVAAAGPVAATVPGSVHTDLLAAGLVDDPYLDDNELRLAWVGHTDWRYETRFGHPDRGAERVDLECDGLDTVATVTLNGVEVGRTANMHRRYRFAVGEHLVAGENRLRIRFGSAYRYAQAQRDRLGRWPAAYPQPFNLVRKMACSFGWDWAPTMVTAGIWRPVRLRSWSVARLGEVRPLVTVAAGAGTVEVHASLERASAVPLVLAAAVGGVTAQVAVAAGQPEAVVRLRVPDPARWWPRGYGEQALHPLRVTLLDTAGAVLDSWSRRIGFRDVRLDTTPDGHGTPYTVVVNGAPVFVRGVNWVPDDCFPSRVTRARYAERLTQAAGANVNYVRVWGGGCYESDDFYDVADELGLMVGQDFAFACAAYPEEEPFASEVAAEARDNVSRLAPHPSLVTWTGNNECQWGHADWGWQAELAGCGWGCGYYDDLLPRIVAELDPTRPYWAGSPWSGSPDRHPNDPSHGTMHIWDVWNQRDYLHYRSYTPRFVAELGYQAPPAFATLRRALSDEPLAPDSPGMRHHQKAEDGAGKLRRGLEAHLPPPRDFDDWLWLTQLNQARAVTVGVEHLRCLRPVCMGSVVWQLNDCWPVTSWAAIDGDGRRKPLWYALRAAYADQLLTVQPRGGGLVVAAVNDSATPWQAQVAMARLTLAGQPLAESKLAVSVPPRAVVTLPLPDGLARPGDPRRELVLAQADGERAWWFFAEDRDLAYPAAGYDAAVAPGAAVTPDAVSTPGALVTVTARALLRDLTLFPDRLDPSATVDRALVTLLPGESVTFVVTSSLPLDPQALTTRPVLRFANDIRSPERFA